MATPLTMLEWFERITFVRIDNHDVAVQVKCHQNSIRRDLSGTIWVAYMGDTFDKALLKKEIRKFVSETAV